MEDFKALMTTEKVAKDLGITPRHVARLVSEGVLQPAIKAPGLRGAMFFMPEEVEHYKAMRELDRAGQKPAA